jgi:hypothetical protein
VESQDLAPNPWQKAWFLAHGVAAMKKNKPMKKGIVGSLTKIQLKIYT